MSATPYPLCPDCGEKIINPGGPRAQPVLEVARMIVNGAVFTDADAIRVAREYLAMAGVPR